jgi:hypothetical protein
MYKFMTCIWMFIDVSSMKHCLYELQHYASMFICSYVLMTILVMHECLYVFYINKIICWVWGIESDVRGGEGPYELPPSRGWPCSVENNLFSKQREAH